MKRTTRTLITTAAITGLLGGVAIHQSRAETTNKTSSSTSSSSSSSSAGKEASKKSPKVQGCSGENDCKGLGGCKTSDHSCKFKNDCKGKGGCSLTDKDIKQWEKDNKK
jgi:hypothetical protein